jgi:hypothetical protein
MSHPTPNVQQIDQTTTQPRQVNQNQLDQKTTQAENNLTKRQLDQNQLNQKSHLEAEILYALFLASRMKHEPTSLC